MARKTAEPFGAYKCPRCHEPTAGEFYGPCEACRVAMRQAVAPAPAPRVAMGAQASKRIWRTIAPRLTAWVDTSGEAADGRRSWSCSIRSARALIESSPADVAVFMLDRRPVETWPDFVAWAGELPAGWSVAGHYLGDTGAPVFRFAGEGRKVEVRMAAPWWGDGTRYGATQAAAAWALVRQVIEHRFDGGNLLASPGATGVELFARSIPAGVEYPTPAEDVAELVRAHSTQGRNEIVPHVELPALVEYDCRWAYAALCGDLPTGPAQWATGDPGDAYDPYRGGWYNVRAIVPDDWRGLGILPHRTSAGVEWPAAAGLVIDGWVSAVELAQARKWGWSTEIRESVTYPEPVKPGPLDKWARRLQACRADVLEDQAHADPVVRDLAGRAVRAILLHGVGSFWAAGREVTCSGPIETAEPPEGALDLRIEGGDLVWTERRPPARPDMVHPEWAATIWARCRARMLDGPGTGGRRTGALHVPAGDVVAIRTDALYLTADPRWDDDGRVGRLRYRQTFPGPIPGPTDHAGLLAITRGDTHG